LVKRSLISPRVATALVGIPLVLLIIWAGRWAFWGVCTVLALISLRELDSAFQRSSNAANARLVALLAYPALLGLMLPATGTNFLWPIGLLVLLLVVAVLAYGPAGKVSLLSLCATLAATLYCGLFAFLPLLRNFDPENDRHGLTLFCLTIFSVWASDTAAYYGGRFFGKHLLTPLSPGKTREGAICGFIAAVVISTSIALGANLGLLLGLALGVTIALAAPIGDLAESFWKRELGIKDLGTLLPGHGGVLDRCDSLIFTSFAVYCVLQLF
jgi:phosphatidate cytidylyltransferase